VVWVKISAEVIMNIHVINRNSGLQGISIMRGKSALANPFRIGVDGDRKQVIEKYRVWLWERMQGDVGNRENMELKRLLAIARKGSLVLVCCCKPLPCHGDVIRASLEWLDKQ
jgi:hypothetical protein